MASSKSKFAQVPSRVESGDILQEENVPETSHDPKLVRLGNIRGLKTRNSREYNSWKCMKRRSLCPTDPGFKYVGARGITVCDRWLHSFAAFLRDMGPRPLGKSLDREDNDGNYEPGNCRWATPLQQARNRSTYNRIVTFEGQSLCIHEWQEKTGINARTITSRLDHFGWPVGQALTISPYQGYASRHPQRLKKTRGILIGPSPVNKTSGFYGISPHKQSGKWQARLMVPTGRPVYVGLFPTIEEANAALHNRLKELEVACG